MNIVAIHKLILLDRVKSIGITLYDTETIKFQSDLLIGLVQALMLLGEELGPSKGKLREAELGKFQLSILSKDHLAYILIHDTYDSEPFTRKLVNRVVDEYHEYFVEMNFNRPPQGIDKVKVKTGQLLQSMKFPLDMLDEIQPYIDQFNIDTRYICDTLLLSDLDDGVISIFKQDDDQIVKILLEILSEIDFEKQWIGESKLRIPKEIMGEKRNFEGWFIFRLGLTDFCLLGRSYHVNSERDLLIRELEILSSNILTELLGSNKI